MFRQRLRLWFRVCGDQRYLSHHDMMRLWERALRRARLPLRMSQGFNPRPKLSLPEPRSVGIASDAELIEFELGDWVSPDDVLRRVRDELPADIEAERLELVRPSEKARPDAVAYEARLPMPADLPERVRSLLDRDEAPVVRHRPGGDKHLDARPFIRAVEPASDGIRMVLETGPRGTVRPDEVLRLLGFDAEAVARADVTRRAIELR